MGVPAVRTVTIVSAPDIPASEIMRLRKAWDRKITKIVTNYEVNIQRVTLKRGYRLVVAAPDIPAIELKQLKRHIRAALADPDYTVITNYEVNVFTLKK